MGFLIDGHNLIGKIPGMSLSALDDEDDLINMLKLFYRMRRKTVEVYFDGGMPGYSGKRRYGAISAFFVPQGSTADAALIQRMRELRRQAKNWIVVSSDRRVQGEARVLGYPVIESHNFAMDLLKAISEIDDETLRQKMNRASEVGLEEWMRLFGLEGDE